VRILVYNWTNFDGRSGGGVSVYLRNLIPELLKRDGVEVVFLSSGEHYGVLRRRPRIEETENLFSDLGVRSFRIINSPVKAPAHDAFYAIDKWRSNDVLFKLIRDFMRDQGPFDVFHLHSLEGISANVLAMNQAMAGTKVFYTLHNYMPYCGQIELLHGGKSQCHTSLSGTKCIGCLGSKHSMNWLITQRRLSSSLSRRGLAGHHIGNFLFGFAEGAQKIGSALRFAFLDIRQGIREKFASWSLKREKPVTHAPLDKKLKLPPPSGDKLLVESEQAKNYQRWREYNAELLNKSVARVFAVSQLVKDTVKGLGEDVQNIDVLPIAMDVWASDQEMRAAFESKPKSGLVTLSFIGYNIPSKGLPFLLEAFEEMNSEYLKNNVKLLIICRMNAAGRRQMARLTTLFREVEVIDGYNRENLPGLAQSIDLNIVPSIWPETFNQVTYEMMALGTPTLVSSNVGAKMLFGKHPTAQDFIFEAGSSADFAAKLMPLVKDRAARARFFDDLPPLPTLDRHVDILLEAYNLYKAGSRVEVQPATEEIKSFEAEVLPPVYNKKANGAVKASPADGLH